jgi:hypothetical protein
VGINDKAPPEQIIPLFTVIVGVMLTVIVETAGVTLTHPCALVPLTLYVVLIKGLTMLLPLE